MYQVIYLLFFAFIFSNNDIAKDKIIVQHLEDKSSFIYNNDEYKIIIEGQNNYNDYYVDNELFIEYRIFKNDVEIYSNDEYNYIYADCDYKNGGPFDFHYDIDIITKDNSYVSINDNYGWIIYTGGICGNTFSYQAEVIFPPLEFGSNVVKSNHLFKSKPNIVYKKDSIDIFYSFQEWNFAGTSWSELIPQKLTYDINNHKIRDAKIEITDFKHLIFDFNIDYTIDLSRNFTSLFMSGFNDMNIELMQYAIDFLYNPEHEEEWYSYFYGSNFEYQRNMFSAKDEKSTAMFLFGMVNFYGHTNIKWIYEFLNEDGFIFHEKQVVNTEYNYLRLIDCSKKSFQNIVDLLR